MGSTLCCGAVPRPRRPPRPPWTPSTTLPAIPKLSEHALAGQYDIAAATRALRADLTWLTTLADAAASIDATLTAADQRQRRQHRRDLVNEQLDRRRATLTAVRAAHRPSPDDLDAATAIAHYATQALTPGQTR